MTDADPAWAEMWAEAKSADMLEVAERLGAKLKHVGADWLGPCPAGCAKHDGFIVTPAKHMFLCRPSGARGDVVDMAAHALGVSKAGAFAFVTGRRMPPPATQEQETDNRAKLAPQRPGPVAKPASEARSSASTNAQQRSDKKAIEAILKRARPVGDTHAWAYLAARLGSPPQPRLTEDLLFVPDLDYWDDDDPPKKIATLPAMVALIRDAAGEVIGIHQTYLDPKEPRKWTPPAGLPAKKIRGRAKGGLIRLGPIGDKLAVGEGIETTLRWHALGVGPQDVTIACGVALDNIAGGCAGTLPHPTLKANSGKPARYPNGEPDMARPGMILPEGVRELILLGDGDSEPLATRHKLAAAARRHLTDGLTVSVHMAPSGKDWANEIGDDMPPIESSKDFLERIAPEQLDPDKISPRDAVLKKIGELKPHDEDSARAVVAAAIQAGLSALAVDSLLKPFSQALGVKEPTAKKFWKEAEDKARAAAAQGPTTAEERARLKREAGEERTRLWASCSQIALSKTLLTDMEKLAHRLGVVGEGASIRGAYLAASSRLCRQGALCLLRRGAPAGGKNFITDKVLSLIPEEDVVRVSSGSPLALIYYGDGDENALKHKIVYVAEAAILAERNGVESVLTIMLRLLISEGRIDHQVVVTKPNAPAITMHMRRNGPVVVLITSARNNIEEELFTRLMTSDADESQEQTESVIAAALADEGGEEDKERGRAAVGQWLDLQRWLALDAPYDVFIPYRPAILQAMRALRQAAKKRGEKPKFRLRIRRDIHGFMTAIRASAILHKAQREKDEKGRIIATLDDYQHAHEAFDPGLASLYKIVSPVTTIAVVRAIEEIGATATQSVKVSVTDIMEKLGIAGRGTANDRLRDAEERGYIKLVEKQGGYGKTTPREYTIAKHAVEIELEAKTSFGSGVFPSREAVEKKNYSPGHHGTVVQPVQDRENYTDCTTVPERPGPYFSSIDEEAPAKPEDPEGQEDPENPIESVKPPRWGSEL